MIETPEKLPRVGSLWRDETCYFILLKIHILSEEEKIMFNQQYENILIQISTLNINSQSDDTKVRNGILSLAQFLCCYEEVIS